ncbi:MAG: sterol desaturase family protein [Burkholderiales bacterium]|nr:MAG: sterol desaturase family protein [Burkholderiales bacterium]
MTIYHYIVIGLFLAFAAADHIGRHRDFPRVRFWRIMGIISFVLYFTIATYAPFLWDEWFGAHQLIDGSRLPFWAQVVSGFLILEFGIYFWHRFMHSNDLVWRLTHQMHHSAERVDIWGAFYFHPVDMLGWALIGSACLVGIFGMTPEAALIVAVLSSIPPMVQHLNVRTPRWLGYFLQRPESHLVHHQRGVHAYNYGDIPLPDMVFGTFRNPREWEGENGFHPGSTTQIPEMLMFRKIS